MLSWIANKSKISSHSSWKDDRITKLNLIIKSFKDKKKFGIMQQRRRKRQHIYGVQKSNMQRNEIYTDHLTP